MTNVQQIEMFEDLIEKVQNVANAIPPANSVPDVESTDNGKVLKATYSEGTGSYDWEDESGGVPDYSQASQGSVLATQYGGELGWDRPENLMPSDKVLPDITVNDNGKVLQAVYDDKSGAYASWVTPSGGGGIQTAMFAKSDFSYDDKSAIYTLDVSNTEIPIDHIINVQTTNGSSYFKNVNDSYELTSGSDYYYTMVIDETAYNSLSNYVKIIYY